MASALTHATIRAFDDDEQTALTVAPGSSRTTVELAGVIGEGGMGVVRAAKQVSLGRDVAVKMLREEGRNLAQVLREAFITSALEHPNIVPVYDLAKDEEDRPLIVMKRVEGRTWDAALQLGAPVPARGAWLEEQLRVFVQVCHAVEFAHSRGILHRDLKPANVMIGDFGEVYVLDWGLAVSLKEEHAGRFPLAEDVRTVSGTPAYMSPEQALAQGALLSPRTDVYLLGSVLHELLTGLPPHHAETVEECVRLAANAGAPSFDASVPEPLATTCRRALARTPSQRFASVTDLRVAIEDFLRHRVSIDLTEKALGRLRELKRRIAGGKADDAFTLHKAFSECRFALQQALDIWAENRTAQESIREATELMAGHALDTGDLRYAEVLLGELRDPNTVLATRLDALRRRAADQAAERDAMVKLGQEFDQRIGLRARLWLATGFGLVFFLRPIVLGLVELSGTPALSAEGELFGSVAFFAMLALLGWTVRRSMFASSLNRLAMGLLAGVGIGTLALRIGAFTIGYPLSVPALGTMLLEVMMIGALALAADLRLAWGGLGVLATSAVVIVWPAAWPFASGIANACILGVILWVWGPAREAGT